MDRSHLLQLDCNLLQQPINFQQLDCNMTATGLQLDCNLDLCCGHLRLIKVILSENGGGHSSFGRIGVGDFLLRVVHPEDEALRILFPLPAKHHDEII